MQQGAQRDRRRRAENKAASERCKRSRIPRRLIRQEQANRLAPGSNPEKWRSGSTETQSPYNREAGREKHEKKGEIFLKIKKNLKGRKTGTERVRRGYAKSAAIKGMRREDALSSEVERTGRFDSPGETRGRGGEGREKQSRFAMELSRRKSPRTR